MGMAQQVIIPQHDNQQVVLLHHPCQFSRTGWDLPAVQTHVDNFPTGTLRQQVRPAALRRIAVPRIGTGVIAVGIGIAKAKQPHDITSFTE